jgi:hypothetical protein
MLIPIIRVKDRSDGKVHIVGTDSHDSLEIIDGGIAYCNHQNGCGTGNGKDYGYEFHCLDANIFGEPHIEFVTIEEFLEIYNRENELLNEQNARFEEFLKERRERYLKTLDDDNAS